MLQRARFRATVLQMTGEGQQPNRSPRVGMNHFRAGAQTGDATAQLLPQLAAQGLVRRFTRLDLAAGKFPEPGQAPAFRATGDQHFPAATNHGADNIDWSLHFHGQRG